LITVVSGLPRSGTSLVMQMLEKGGMEILTDHVRKPDKDNIRGYYEYEKVKSLKRDNSWLSEAENKAVKIIAQLLPFLLPQYQYSVLFVERPMDEILSSQAKMLESREQPAADSRQLETIFVQQVKRIKSWIENQSNIRILCLQYHRLMLHPEEEVPKIPEFLCVDMNLEAMVSVIEPSLWHYRSTLADSDSISEESS
jgi:hypothetical protein